MRYTREKIGKYYPIDKYYHIRVRASNLLYLFYLYFYSAGILTTATTLLINPLTDFLSDIPYFTIIGKTQGGPPTSRNWTKDGMVLTSSETFNISIVAIAENSESRYQHSVYESTLVVMGRQPGLYQYSATNTLSTLWTDTIAIEGMILLSCTAPYNIELFIIEV